MDIGGDATIRARLRLRILNPIPLLRQPKIPSPYPGKARMGAIPKPFAPQRLCVKSPAQTGPFAPKSQPSAPFKPCLTIRHSDILCALSAVRVVEIEEDTCGTVMARMPSMPGRQPASPVRLWKPGRAHSLQGMGLQQPRLRVQYQNPQRRRLSERAHRQWRKTRAARPLAVQQAFRIPSVRNSAQPRRSPFMPFCALTQRTLTPIQPRRICYNQATLSTPILYSAQDLPQGGMPI